METSVRSRVLLAPTDMSAESLAAVTYASNLTRTMGGSLVLLHVISPVAVEEGLAENRYVDRLLEDVRAELIWWFTTFVPQAARQNVRFLTMAAIGHPADEIIAAAESLHAEMIIMATHGRRGLRRAVLGSVAEAVLRHAPCPVLTIRAVTAAAGGTSLPKTASVAGSREAIS